MTHFVGYDSAGDLFVAVAGAGDVLSGLLAIPLAVAIARGQYVKAWAALWNAFGALDLVTALTLGALAQEAVPSIAPITQLPLVLIPGVLVPILLLIHLTVAYRLAAAPAGRPALAV